MFKISENNFNDWFRQLKMVLRVERKLFVIEQPISPALPTDSEYLRSGKLSMFANRIRENQLAHMSLYEELCETRIRPIRNRLKLKGKDKANVKGKDKQVYIPKLKNPKHSPKEHPAKDDTCHHCKE
ncbi:hypothetical protein Tco_1372900, partial [Tanacetum coccineum]